jgi:hypothetical protein
MGDLQARFISGFFMDIYKDFRLVVKELQYPSRKFPHSYTTSMYKKYIRKNNLNKDSRQPAAVS